MVGGCHHVPVILRSHLGTAGGVLDHHQGDPRHRIQRRLRRRQRRLVGVRENEEHASRDGLPDHAEPLLDVERSVHLGHPEELPAERLDRLFVAVAETLDDGALDVDRLLGEIRRKGVEHAGLRVGDGALADSQNHALGQRFQLAIHHLEDEAGATVGCLVRPHLPLERRLAGRRGRRTSEPLGLHGRFQRPSPVDARHCAPRNSRQINGFPPSRE